jgi:hypothetical protein
MRSRAGSAVGTEFLDSIAGFENASGGFEPQIIAGDEARNLLRGGGGADVIDAGDAEDVVEGGSGGDKLAGGRGRDTIRGGRGDDQCLEGEDVTGCETVASRGSEGSSPIPRSVSGATRRAPVSIVLGELPLPTSKVLSMLRILLPQAERRAYSQ